MKEVMAVIRQNKINQTKEALVEAGFSAFTARKVFGRGKGLVDQVTLEGASQGCTDAIAQLGQHPQFYPKRLLTIVVPDDKVSKLVQTLIDVNKTSRPGDGKIFVMPVLEAYRVRTGEVGADAIDEVSSK
ncbi:MAG TPA: P-II family nitrogen regulator [Thermodesulfovibrionia bacterium]|nr:P-II family nitrogen regulator [Thermodesulfovibrionia bacterium]